MMEGVSRLLKSKDDDANTFRRFPLRRIQPVLKRFIKVFQLDLYRLRQHRQNIAKFSGESNELTRELSYAMRSVEQLIVTIRQLKQTRAQVELCDLSAFDVQLTEILNDAVLITAQFLVWLSEGQDRPAVNELELPPEELLPSAGAMTFDEITQCSICAEMFVDPRGLPCMHTFCLKCLQQYAKGKHPGYRMFCPICRREFSIPAGGINTFPKNFMMSQLIAMTHPSEAKAGEKKIECDEQKSDDSKTKLSSQEDEASQALQEKLIVFNDNIQDLFALIQSGDSGLKSVDATSLSSEQKSSTNLSAFKVLLLPVAGAVIGGALAGPVGLVAGLKAGKMAAIGGGLLGLTGGTILKKKATDRSASVEETANSSYELSQVRSVSSPAIAESVCEDAVDERKQK